MRASSQSQPDSARTPSQPWCTSRLKTRARRVSARCDRSPRYRPSLPGLDVPGPPVHPLRSPRVRGSVNLSDATSNETVSAGYRGRPTRKKPSISRSIEPGILPGPKIDLAGCILIREPAMCHAGVSMRDPETIETELMEISAIADDAVKLERIIAWCASHPDEVPFAMRHLMNRRDRQASRPSGG